MKTIRMHAHGTPDVLQLEDAPHPSPGVGEVVVRVDAAGVNFSDVVRRRGDVYPFPTPLPFTPGAEVAGTVHAVGEGVQAPPVGTAVFGLVGAGGSGGYAQFAVADARQLVPVPPGVGLDEASGIVVAGATAVLALVEVARVGPGDTVLVEGAGGGVGGYAVQVARLLGATVVAAAGTPRRRAAALDLGADHVVDYTDPGWTDRVREVTDGRGVDAVLETAGGDTFGEALSVLAPFGRVVVAGMAGRAPLALEAERVRRFFYDPAPNQVLHAFNLGLWFGLRPQESQAALQRLVGWVAQGQVRVPPGRTLPLAEAARAHELLETRQTTGKLVLAPWD
jgi:NADPH2:quinone reductase